jgi:hypothetical protein
LPITPAGNYSDSAWFDAGRRMAMGARRSDVVRCVPGQYGMVFGCGVAAVAAKAMGGVFRGSIPFDLASFGAGLALFALVALAASLEAVRRALRTGPASALR